MEREQFFLRKMRVDRQSGTIISHNSPKKNSTILNETLEFLSSMNFKRKPKDRLIPIL